MVCVGLGSGWALLLAQQHLADLRPEGAADEIQVVVVALPQSFEGGERFEFAVELVAARRLPTCAENHFVVVSRLAWGRMA